MKIIGLGVLTNLHAPRSMREAFTPQWVRAEARHGR